MGSVCTLAGERRHYGIRATFDEGEEKKGQRQKAEPTASKRLPTTMTETRKTVRKGFPRDPSEKHSKI
jgi:hypothetical protein